MIKNVGHPMRVFASISVLCAALLLGGCTEPTETAPSMPNGTAKGDAKELWQPDAQAGVSLDETLAYKDLLTVDQIAAKRHWWSRSDPFSLTLTEGQFERSQAMERVLNETGGFGDFFEVPEPPVEEPPRIVPVPAWRLAGIAVTEGAVTALLDRGRGGNMGEVIVPGQTVEGTDWVCISIDSEKARFRRPGNQLPKEFDVPLQGTMPSIGGGGAPAGGGGGNQGRGGNGGGNRGDGGEPGGDIGPGRGGG